MFQECPNSGKQQNEIKNSDKYLSVARAYCAMSSVSYLCPYPMHLRQQRGAGSQVHASYDFSIRDTFKIY